MPDLPAPLGVLEVRDERVDRSRLEPERRQAAPGLVRRHRLGNAIVLKRSVGQPRSPATRRSSRSGFTAIGVADRFEERHVGVRVGVRGRRGEIERLVPRQLGERVRFRLPVQPPLETTRVHAVAHLGTRRDRAGEAELPRDLLDDLLQRR